jgi:hypothetical protein
LAIGHDPRSAPADRSSKEITMKKSLSVVLATAAIAGMLVATVVDADAQRRGRGGWGWGPAILGTAIIAGAIIATQPRGYVQYRGYGQPVYGPGCYWAAEPIYNRRGEVVGYTGEPVQVCPGYR